MTPEAVCDARSTRPERLERQLAGDLDNILMMALRKEPERRYGSVEQFANDLRRHLQGPPGDGAAGHHPLPHQQVHPAASHAAWSRRRCW